MEIFVVHHTNFDYKPGHMYLSCDGVFTTWENALRRALDYNIEVTECQYCGESDVSEMSYYKDVGFVCGECKDCMKDDVKEVIKMEEYPLPTTEEELKNFIPSSGCIWDFTPGESAQWWDGEDCGANLFSISKEKVQEKN
jgi:hypothetical protein